jgi:Flp pilus assembly protein TadG
VPTRLHRSVRGLNGSSLIEAALITVVVLLFSFSVAEFAVLGYVYLTLQSGVREATQHAVNGDSLDDTARAESIKAVMRAAASSLTLDDDAFTFEHKTPPDQTWVAGLGRPSDAAKVTVRYRWKVLSPAVRPLFADGNFELHVESAMTSDPHVRVMHAE